MSNGGYTYSRSVYNKDNIKTDAPISFIYSIVRSFARLYHKDRHVDIYDASWIDTLDTLGKRIMSMTHTHDVSFDRCERAYNLYKKEKDIRPFVYGDNHQPIGKKKIT